MLEQGVGWFAQQFYSPSSIYERLLLKSRVGLWWNLPRNLGYRLALAWKRGVCFGEDADVDERPSAQAGGVAEGPPLASPAGDDADPLPVPAGVV